MALILPEKYDPHLSVRETQEAIKYIRDHISERIWKRDESGKNFSASFRYKEERTE